MGVRGTSPGFFFYFFFLKNVSEMHFQDILKPIFHPYSITLILNNIRQHLIVELTEHFRHYFKNKVISPVTSIKYMKDAGNT